MSELFPQTAREYALERVARALYESLPPATPSADLAPEALAARAETLIAIAESFGVTDEELLIWTRYRMPGKEWSGAECRRWCEKLVETKRELAARGTPVDAALDVWQPARCGHCAELLETEAQARSHVCHMLCTRCYAHSAQRVGGRWICANCGEVE
jgi:hypothetical protein